MFIFILIIHVIICLFLIGIILIQSGRGGGLVESFSGMESMFGTKTNTFLIRITTVLASLFIITCLTLTLLSSRQTASIVERIKVEPKQSVEQNTTNTTGQPKTTIP